MKIAQIAPLEESVPPKVYGGTERVVSFLTEELVHQGHDVTLFASGDSVTGAVLVRCCRAGLRLDPSVISPLPHQARQMELVRQLQDEFDILHFHTEFLHFPLLRHAAAKTLTTLHGRLDLPDMPSFYADFSDFPLASVSDAQRAPMPEANWAGTVLHGLPPDLLPFRPEAGGGYLAFLGRISPEKRPDRAIEIAVRTGLPLKIAAKVDKADAPYWADVIRPLVERSPSVEFVGEVDECGKAEFLSNALALLFPIDWPEPFGLVMIEAMSCGTPVLAFRSGSVPEVIEDGVSGFAVESIDEAVAAVPLVCDLDRHRVRQAFERRFTAARMAQRYLEVYAQLLAASQGAGTPGEIRMPAVDLPLVGHAGTFMPAPDRARAGSAGLVHRLHWER